MTPAVVCKSLKSICHVQLCIFHIQWVFGKGEDQTLLFLMKKHKIDGKNYGESYGTSHWFQMY